MNEEKVLHRQRIRFEKARFKHGYTLGGLFLEALRVGIQREENRAIF
jgi:hypothetical protein